MLRISSETGGKLACRRDRLLHSHGCEAHSAEQPADDHPHLLSAKIKLIWKSAPSHEIFFGALLHSAVGFISGIPGNI